MTYNSDASAAGAAGTEFGPSCHFVRCSDLVAIGGKADVANRVESDAIDPYAT
jgi:hypothetical protein